MAGKLWTVPKGTKASQCRSCKALIYWIKTPNDKNMPVDCEVTGGEEPTAEYDGTGVSHFETCEDAKTFSGRNR